MLNVCIAGWNSSEADSAHSMLRGRPDFRVSDIHSTGAEVVETLRRTRVDAVVVPADWIDVARALKRLVFPALSAEPSLVLVTHLPRLAVRARALSCGFDGAIDLSKGSDEVAMGLLRINDASLRLEDDSDLKGLGIVPGLLTRDLVLARDEDTSLADLIATGASDEAIALAMGWTIQMLRNRITELLSANGMTYRTQLAVARASSVRIPDFVRPFSE